MPEDTSPDPSRQPTDDEVSERIDHIRDLMARHRRKSTIKRLFRQTYGQLDSCTIELYLQRARARITEDAARSRSDMRAELRERLDVVTEGADVRDQVRGVEVTAKLYGLNLEVPPLEQVCAILGLTAAELSEAVARYKRDRADDGN